MAITNCPAIAKASFLTIHSVEMLEVFQFIKNFYIWRSYFLLDWLLIVKKLLFRHFWCPNKVLKSYLDWNTVDTKWWFVKIPINYYCTVMAIRNGAGPWPSNQNRVQISLHLHSNFDKCKLSLKYWSDLLLQAMYLLRSPSPSWSRSAPISRKNSTIPSSPALSTPESSTLSTETVKENMSQSEIISVVKK